jgi:hypothetical protein
LKKNTTFHPNRFSRMFNVVIQMYELREIYISGEEGNIHGSIIRKGLL